MIEQRLPVQEVHATTASRFNQDVCWLLLLVLIFIANYLIRPVDLTIRGEESRRGRIAWEMVHTEDWVVPRLQGEPRLTRPPLHYWAIAICGYSLGTVDAWAIRLPSLFAVLATGFLVYWYVRNNVSPVSAFFAGMSVMTFGQVLQLGRLGESDATFMFLMAGSLLLWHGGRLSGWTPWIYQILAYTFLAGATLTKGPQAPVYFAGTVGLYLIGTRRIKELFTPAHLVGVLVFLVIINSWHLLFLQQLSTKALYVAYFGEVEKRFTDASSIDYMLHLLQYPLEILGAALFSWSILLLAFGVKAFRVQFANKQFPFGFAVLAMCVAWPTVWFPASSNTRYFMCMLPCVAVILSYTLETIIRTEALESSLKQNITAIWHRFNWTMITLIGIACMGLICIKLINPEHVLASERLSVILLLSGITLIFYFLRESQPKFGTQLFLWGLIIGISIHGPYMAVLADRANHAEVEVQQVRKLIPANGQLVSLGLNHHLFTYYWEADLPIVRPDSTTKVYPSQLEYFCYHNPGNKPLPDFGFHWEELARVNCDRNLREVPYDVVIVGKLTRLTEAQDAATSLK